MGLLNRLFGDGISDELNHEINSILSSFTLPNMKTDLNNARIIEKLNLSKSILSFRLNWPYPAKSLQASTQAKLSELFCQLDGITQIDGSAHGQDKGGQHDRCQCRSRCTDYSSCHSCHEDEDQKDQSDGLVSLEVLHEHQGETE